MTTDTYALRVQLEREGYNQVEALASGLAFKHFTVVAQEVFNRAETNAQECGGWLEEADSEAPPDVCEVEAAMEPLGLERGAA